MTISIAQSAEDVRLRRAFGDKPAGLYVDLGANDPAHNAEPAPT